MKRFIDKKELEELAHKYRLGTITEAEKAKFDSWFNQHSDTPLFVADESRPNAEEHENILFEKIRSRIAKEVPKPRKIFPWKKLSVAAAMLLFVGFGGWYILQRDIADQVEQATVQIEDIAPAQEKATLTLADGRKIELSGLDRGEIAKLNGIEIQKSEDGLITYSVVATDTKATSLYNELSTAKGEQFQIVLADGTRVWLNSGTKLRFPQHFDGQGNRQVYLEGEAYFEVAHNAQKPFIVKSDDQQVEVLGTHFNINNYPEDSGMKTTLLEGSVRINKQTLLKPNQQAVSSTSGVRVYDVVAQDYIDWKSGIFTFKNENIVAVMRKLARWYDVDVAFQSDEIFDRTFTGNISRREYVSKVLYILEQSSDLKFTLQGRKITVVKNENNQ
jgi:ferric-dicitrate binding protein FerR (iron transport regulator)